MSSIDFSRSLHDAAAAENRVKRKQTEQRRKGLKVGLTGATALAVVSLLSAYGDRLSLAPDAEDVAMGAAQHFSDRLRAECGIAMKVPPSVFSEIEKEEDEDDLTAQVKATTSELSELQEACFGDVLNTLSYPTDGCTVVLGKSGWRPDSETGTPFVVRVDCLSAYMPEDLE